MGSKWNQAIKVVFRRRSRDQYEIRAIKNQQSFFDSKEVGLLNTRKSSDQESFKLMIKQSKTIIANQKS